ncbi:MAG: hypothetical protein ACHQ50_06425 [Fimbriimonadales bacterium]
MVQFALIAAFVLSSQPPPTETDVWYWPYIDVTDHSPFDHTPAPAGYDARDMFGGTASTVPHEQGHVVFEDDSGGPGEPDFVEWNTKDPVVIDRLVISWQDDAPGNDWRNLARFWILGRRTTGDKWQVLWQENTPSRVGRYTLEKKIAAQQCQFFRAEFLRGAASNVTAVGPRICALEAYGHVMPGSASAPTHR